MPNYKLPALPRSCPKCGEPLEAGTEDVCPACSMRIRRDTIIRQKKRSPVLAAILSFLFCGWGQWYNGRTADGLKYFALSFFFIVLTWGTAALALIRSLSILLIAAVILLLGTAGIWICGMYDAYMTSKRINTGTLAFTRKSRLFWLPVIIVIIQILAIVFFFAVTVTKVLQSGVFA